MLEASSVSLATIARISTEVIGVTVVALCTSLPELVTAITALAKGLGALSLGNIIGANIFNLVLVSGTAVTISPFVIPEGSKLFGYNTSQIIEIPIMVGEFFCITFYSHPHSGWLFGLLFEQTSLKALIENPRLFFISRGLQNSYIFNCCDVSCSKDGGFSSSRGYPFDSFSESVFNCCSSL